MAGNVPHMETVNESQAEMARSAARIVSVDGGFVEGLVCELLLGGTDDAPDFSAHLVAAVSDGRPEKVSASDWRVVLRGCIASVVLSANDTERVDDLTMLAAEARAAGLSLRSIAAAAGVTHTAIRHRLTAQK